MMTPEEPGKFPQRAWAGTDLLRLPRQGKSGRFQGLIELRLWRRADPCIRAFSLPVDLHLLALEADNQIQRLGSAHGMNGMARIKTGRWIS